jgi:hypothetical protein
MERGDLLIMLERALEQLPPTALQQVVAGFFHPEDFQASPGVSKSLLTEVEQFCEAARKGKYYESFNVNSRNSTTKSAGTEAFIAELDRLYKRCIREAAARPDRATRDAFERLFELERDVDADPDSIVFFADEAGAWQLYTNWGEVLPAWVRCLAATAEPDEFAKEVDRHIREFCEYERPQLLTTARSVASAAQKKALAAVLGPKTV